MMIKREILGYNFSGDRCKWLFFDGDSQTDLPKSHAWTGPATGQGLCFFLYSWWVCEARWDMGQPDPMLNSSDITVYTCIHYIYNIYTHPFWAVYWVLSYVLRDILPIIFKPFDEAEVLTALIIWKVPFTNVDWEAYMAEAWNICRGLNGCWVAVGWPIFISTFDLLLMEDMKICLGVWYISGATEQDEPTGSTVMAQLTVTTVFLMIYIYI